MAQYFCPDSWLFCNHSAWLNFLYFPPTFPRVSLPFPILTSFYHLLFLIHLFPLTSLPASDVHAPFPPSPSSLFLSIRSSFFPSSFLPSSLEAPDFCVSMWARITKNTDWSTGPLARPFARSLTPLTRTFAPHYSLCLRAPLRSLPCSLTHFAHSIARRIVND